MQYESNQTHLKKRNSSTELSVLRSTTVALEHSTATWSHSDPSKTVTKGRKNSIKYEIRQI